MEEFPHFDYYFEIRNICREAVKEAEGDAERAQDLLHEMVDGHQWIIYTYYNHLVLLHSSNSGAYFEDFGVLEADSVGDAMLKMAFAAMYRDASDGLQDALDEYEAEED